MAVKNKPLLFFYVLVVYVLLQFSWWSYLLIDLNREVYELQNPGVAATTVAGFSKLEKKWLMVAGEGFVFLAILVLGIYKTRQAFKKEFALARQQKNFLLSVTHEFKSPLAAIKLNLQTIKKRELTREQQLMILDSAVAETDRINDLLENTLLAARIDSRNFHINKEQFSISEVVKSVVDSKNLLESRSGRITQDIQPGIFIAGDRLAIVSVVLNLIENALKYSPENEVVHVQLKSNHDKVTFSVLDYGSGVPVSERAAIFQKFYRIGNEDTRSTKGTGLGLFIVRHLVDYHGGSIHIKDNSPRGSVFEITLPLN